MRVILLILLLFPLVSPVKAQAMLDPTNSAAVSTANLDLLLERAMSENLIAGGVVVVGNHEGIIATAARGQVSGSAGAPAITDRTLFDVASLTKVIATTPAVIKLLDATERIGITCVVHDETGYYESRDEAQLLKSVDEMNRLIARFAGQFSDAYEKARGDSRQVQGEIFRHPDFERLETE